MREESCVVEEEVLRDILDGKLVGSNWRGPLILEHAR